ncbi:glycosyltransferase [Granulicoccus phenolivorans]|uniref:glycosyltransferase n=1 Tax=Granulicoccus phenolivorans TaxID=266854 RepID=UPI00138AD589|nr:glycosyltransferase [Granulicoccus phenolivorans]
MAPDLPTASGGLMMMYAIAEALDAGGLPATVWHGTPGLRYDTFDSAAPVFHGLEAELRPGDLLVLAETGGPKWQFLAAGAPVVMLCQGYTFAYQFLTPQTPVEPGYPGWPNVRAVVATSDYIAAVVGRLSGDLPVHRVPVLVDDTVFRPAAKQRVVAYMPRRRRTDIEGALQLLRRTGTPAGWEFVAIEGATRAEVAEILGRAAIYLSGAERDGFGLPGAEAMAAGCHVVGFTGTGGAEYLRADTASVVHDDDVLALADALDAAIRAYDSGADWFAERTARGRDLVRNRYAPEVFAREVRASFGTLLAPDSAAVLTEPIRVQHYQAHAPATGWWPTAYRGARRLARRTLTALRRP